MGVCKTPASDSHTTAAMDTDTDAKQSSGQPVDGRPAESSSQSVPAGQRVEDAEETVIPWSFVPPALITKLVHKLNPELLLSGNNWRALAWTLGMKSEDIRFIESVQGVHSQVLLEAYESRGGGTLNEIKAALKSINRKDCVEVIERVEPEIRQKIRENNLSMQQATSMVTGLSGIQWPDRPMMLPSVFSNGSSGMAAAQPASGVYCMPMSLGHVASSHCDSGTSQMQGHPSLPGTGTPPCACRGAASGLGTGTGCCFANGNAGMMSGTCVAGIQYVCAGHQQRQHLVQQDFSCMPVNAMLPQNISPVDVSNTNNGYSSINSGCSNFNNTCSTHKHWGDGNVGSASQMDCSNGAKIARQFSDDCQGGQQAYHHGNKHFKHSVSSPTQSHCPHCGKQATLCYGTSSPLASLNSHPSVMWPSMSMSCTSSQAPSNGAQPGTCQKLQNLNCSGCAGHRETVSSPKKLFIPSPTLSCFAEKAQFPSPSPSPGSSHGSCECRASRSISSSSNNSSGQNTASPSHARAVADGGFFPPRQPASRKDSQISPRQGRASAPLEQDSHLDKATTTAQASEGKKSFTSGESDLQAQGTSLALLEKIAAIPDKYKPTSEYQAVVAEQKIEAERGKKAGRNSATQTSSSSAGSLSSSSAICSASQTFPMRFKGRNGQGGATSSGVNVEELGALTISKKSMSMPQDMKPQPYRKAWRGIKVFVTYSMDSPAHNNQILCLGYFLKRNGFNCYLDTPFSPGKSLEAWQEHTEKFHRKFYESDFVLVCISPKYLLDVSVSDPAAAHESPAEACLHTLDIYQLMNREYLNRQAFGDGLDGGAHGEGSEQALGRESGMLFSSTPSSSSLSAPSSEMPHSPQVVPVLFGNMTASQIPHWMREVGVPCKRWEADYADLAWLLTKPQDRIQPRRQRMLDNGGNGF
ncbi:MgCIKSL [Plakobranchus ocellatus]|uniref:MgCIKSL n=1 Tax=Plakobranchus ocellatus TaxID=259542 RepID=A0AAV3Y005_9GAST|nr:MgCIKSL [Plakobranchus ocellatus]